MSGRARKGRSDHPIPQRFTANLLEEQSRPLLVNDDLEAPSSSSATAVISLNSRDTMENDYTISKSRSLEKAAEQHQKDDISGVRVGDVEMDDLDIKPSSMQEVAGVTAVEAAQAVWGSRGWYAIWLGIAMMMIAYEFDNSTVYVYQNYAPSEFNALSQKATLATAGTIVFAVVKPAIAKFSDVKGRPAAYLITISAYLLAYVLTSASKNFGTYAAGIMFYNIGQGGTNTLNDIVIGDITSTRWRAFAFSVQFLPFLLTPWVAAFICDAVINGPGWRWGIGMFAFIMPVCASCLIGTLFYYQRKAKKMHIVVTEKIRIRKFFSFIDGGGLFLLVVGFAMLFIPISVASTTTSRWKAPWVPAVMVVGAVLLIALIPYEKFIAKHPILPLGYFRNATIVLSAIIIFLDAISFNSTHTYLYSWVVIAHNYGIRKATFFNYVNGVVQALIGILVGLVVARTRRYKWILFSALIIRTIGYGVMVRLRGENNSDAELFIVQAIQGVGSGVVATLTFVAPQIVVPHAELAQISALILLCSFLGSGVGSAMAGGIYTNYFLEELRKHMGPDASESVINAVYNSITSTELPAWGTPERIAANYAYSDVMRYISIAALACSALPIALGFFMPDLRLTDEQNLYHAGGGGTTRDE